MSNCPTNSLGSFPYGESRETQTKGKPCRLPFTHLSTSQTVKVPGTITHSSSHLLSVGMCERSTAGLAGFTVATLTGLVQQRRQCFTGLTRFTPRLSGAVEMTDEEFMERMLNAFPLATVDEDNEGQLIINTGLRRNSNGEVVPFTD